MITGDKKTIREIIEAHKLLTHEELIDSPEIKGICYFMGAALGNQDAADVAIAIASLFGSMAFDAEMQHALPTCRIKEKGQTHSCQELWPFKEREWCEECSRNTIAATFEERLELFGVHARAGYKGVKAFAAKEQIYHDKGTH